MNYPQFIGGLNRQQLIKKMTQFQSDNWNKDFSGDEDGDAEDDWEYGGRNGILFLVDCRESMFKTTDQGTSNFRLAMECVEAVLMNRIILSDTDLVNMFIWVRSWSSTTVPSFRLESCSLTRKRVPIVK